MNKLDRVKEKVALDIKLTKEEECVLESEEKTVDQKAINIKIYELFLEILYEIWAGNDIRFSYKDKIEELEALLT
jgi:hypothetical protein